MSEMDSWTWVGLVGLGVFHGANPGMGWLFAVALGMQEGNRRAVWRAMIPLGAGHALAIAVTIVVALAAGALVPVERLRWPVALLLVALGALRMVRHRHPRWAQMRVSMTRLTWWSFLMATAHGAGLMVLPVFLTMSETVAAGGDAHTATVAASAAPGAAVAATLVHSLAYLAITALAAVLVFEKLGLRLLRTAWVNLDVVWAAALFVAGVATVLA